MTTASIHEQLLNRWDDTASAGYSADPVQWVADKPQEFMWSKQREIAESVRDNRYTAVPSAHELGKSFIASRLIAWWIDSHPVGQALVISTAPSAAQVSTIMWKEVARVHGKARLQGRILSSPMSMWKIGTEPVGFGRKPGDYEESSFQGQHARYVLVIIDEAGGVHKNLYTAIDSIVANDNSRVLAIGNPDDPGSHFAHICKPGSGWNVLRLDGLRSPRMSEAEIVGIDPQKPRYPLTKALMEAEGIPYSTEQIPYHLTELLMGPLYVEESLRRWAGFTDTAHLDYDYEELKSMLRSRSEASALFLAKVRGVFPSSTATGVIPLGWVQAAVDRWHDYRARYGTDFSNVPNPSRCVTGVDVAYGGQDETAIAVRYGDVVADIYRFRHADTIETADAAAVYCHTPGSMAVVDVIGIGAGVYDTLRRYKRDAKILAETVPFNASASTKRTDLIGQFKFKNDRAAAWWKVREWLDPSRGSQACLPDDERLIEELVTVKYKHLSGGVIQIESKDDIRKRLGRSTDTADAVIQSKWVDGLEFSLNDGERHEFTKAGYVPLSDDDLAATPGMLGGSGLGTVPVYGLDSGEFGEWDL